MDATLKHKLFTYLAGAAIAFSSGSVASAKTGLVEIPEPVIMELLSDVDGDDWRENDLLRLMELLAEDPRQQVRRRAAEFLTNFDGKGFFEGVEPILLKLAGDSDPAVRASVTGTIAHWLASLDQLVRARLVLEWSVSGDSRIRLILAQALASGVPSFGADLALEYLGEDADSEIRRAAIEAIKRRFRENPDFYRGVLKRRLTDKDRLVRRAARRAIVHTHKLEHDSRAV
jgi:HEAT repeat protein